VLLLLQELVAGHGEAITAEVLEGMAYGGACIREALRMDPPVTGACGRWAAGRQR
jgi:hypothetical protein